MIQTLPKSSSLFKPACYIFAVLVTIPTTAVCLSLPESSRRHLHETLRPSLEKPRDLAAANAHSREESLQAGKELLTFADKGNGVYH